MIRGDHPNLVRPDQPQTLALEPSPEVLVRLKRRMEWGSEPRADGRHGGTDAVNREGSHSTQRRRGRCVGTARMEDQVVPERKGPGDFWISSTGWMSPSWAL